MCFKARLPIDTTNIMLSLLFGGLGAGMLMFGKKTGRMVPLGAGLGLLVCPYFIPNTIAMIIVCCALSATPFVLRDG